MTQGDVTPVRYVTPAIRLDESGMWVLRKYHEVEINRLREALQDIAEGRIAGAHHMMTYAREMLGNG